MIKILPDFPNTGQGETQKKKKRWKDKPRK
jgi:hypothetical protein